MPKHRGGSINQKLGVIDLEKWSDFDHLPCCPEQINYGAGEVIYFPSDPAERIYRIHRGKVKLSYLAESGRRLTVAILGPGDIFGELDLFSRGEQLFLAEVWEDVCICPIDLRQLRQQILEDAELSLEILSLLGRHEQKLLEKLFRLHFQSVPQRIARELLELAQKWGEPSAEGVAIYITHQELAYLIGAARETTTAALDCLAQEGLLDTGRGHSHGKMVLLDPLGLRAVAEGQRLVPARDHPSGGKC